MNHYSISRTGDNEINEDFVQAFEIENRYVFILADGLGGHGFGEVASKEAADCVKKAFESHRDVQLRMLMSLAFREANNRLIQLQENSGETSSYKTTLVVLAVENDGFIWGHIGDSRLYHFEDNILLERSMDHSVPQMLANAGKISEKQIRHHEDRSKLLKALGDSRETFSPYIGKKAPIGKKAAFLLCSDGFWEHIDERYMQKLLKKSSNAEEWIKLMTAVVERNGRKYKMDNYSAIGVML